MKSRDFVYWLQGYIELGKAVADQACPPPNSQQWAMIQAHLALVFKHEIDPEGGDAKMQEALNALHSGKKKDKVQIGGVDPHDPTILYRC